MRINWHEHAINLAKAASKRSEDPYRQVGACVLNKNYEVLAVAYNGLASGKTVSDDFWDDRDRRLPYMIHAETNVLAMIKKGEGQIIACTLLPCSNCAINIAAHGIKTVLYSELYDRDSKALELFKFYNIECFKVS